MFGTREYGSRNMHQLVPPERKLRVQPLLENAISKVNLLPWRAKLAKPQVSDDPHAPYFRKVFDIEELDPAVQEDIGKIIEKRNETKGSVLEFGLSRLPLILTGVVVVCFYVQENRERIAEAILALPAMVGVAIFYEYLRETRDARKDLKSKVDSGAFFKDPDMRVVFPPQTHVYFSQKEIFYVRDSESEAHIERKPGLVFSSGNWMPEILREAVAPVSWAHRGSRTRDLPFLLTDSVRSGLERRRKNKEAQRAERIDAKIAEIEEGPAMRPGAERRLQKLRRSRLGKGRQEELMKQKKRLEHEIFVRERERNGMLNFNVFGGRGGAKLDRKRLCALTDEIRQREQELEQVEAELKGARAPR